MKLYGTKEYIIIIKDKRTKTVNVVMVIWI